MEYCGHRSVVAETLRISRPGLIQCLILSRFLVNLVHLVHSRGRKMLSIVGLNGPFSLLCCVRCWLGGVGAGEGP